MIKQLGMWPLIESVLCISQKLSSKLIAWTLIKKRYALVVKPVSRYVIPRGGIDLNAINKLLFWIDCQDLSQVLFRYKR